VRKKIFHPNIALQGYILAPVSRANLGTRCGRMRLPIWRRTENGLAVGWRFCLFMPYLVGKPKSVSQYFLSLNLQPGGAAMTIFNIGTDDKHIAPMDEGGVPLAAIQGLNQKMNGKDAEIQQLQQSIAQLQTQVAQLSRGQSK
jgi:hypothetical protein